MQIRPTRNPLPLLSAAVALALSGCNSDGQASVAPTAPIAPTVPPVIEPPPPPPVITDDTQALQALLSAGGTIQLEARVYHTTAALIATVSGTTLRGAGPSTVIEFSPPPVGAARNPGVNDRVIGSNSMASTTQLPIARSIAKGDTSFEASNAADAASLKPGDWVVVTVNDPGVADENTHLGYPTYVDWAQVSYVDGTTVHTVEPFRMAFPNALPFRANDSGLGFVRVKLLQNLTVEDLTITVDAGAPAVGVYVLGTLGTTLKDVTINDPTSDAVYAEEAKGLSIVDCKLSGDKVLNEFSESVDLTISGTTFSYDTVAIALDLGTGFFSVTGNAIAHSGHVALYAFYNVHDGTISNNIIDPITNINNVGTIGLWLHGSPNITMSGNTITGPGTTAIEAEGDPSAELLEPSTGDVATGNIISGFQNSVLIH